ncbi:hypothetical protein [Acinetobacter populi]|uniref:hypothetical protein n=1 Tax=Acinetobacter populi TaxID=1582270 RepID=UPI000B3EB8C9|nr:hypothetical protein [Acinetobacter populi]
MNIKLLAGLLITLPLVAVACSKKEAPAQDQATAEQTTTTAEVTPEQQAAIDSVDKPNPEAIATDDAATADAAEATTDDAATAPTESTTEHPAQ